MLKINNKFYNIDNEEQDDRGTGYLPPLYVVPKDDEGYIQSFTVEQPEEMLKFFKEFGFVVVRDVLTPTECEATIDDMWNILKAKKIDRSKRATWDNELWRLTGLFGEGILGYDPFWTHQALKNRQNPNLHKAYSILYGREDLLVNHDRYGLFRPTKVDPDDEADGSWQTMYNVHLDMNPWSYVADQNSEYSEKVLAGLKYRNFQDFITENNEVGCLKDGQLNIQGLINLADNKEEDGGFQLIPGFHRHIQEFAAATQSLVRQYGKRSTFIVFPGNEPLHDRVIRITAKAGSAILWNQCLAHGSAPNNSHRARYAQFFKMFPASPMNENRSKLRSEAVQKKLNEVKFTEVTELGEKLFGLKPWK